LAFLVVVGVSVLIGFIIGVLLVTADYNI